MKETYTAARFRRPADYASAFRKLETRMFVTRTVLEFLYEHPESTVGEISKGVSHSTGDVEIVVDRLLPILREGKKESTKTYSVDAEYVEIWSYILRILGKEQEKTRS